MNEKEKKAIDFLKETNFDYLDYDMCVSSVKIISNLVERLQKENEELKEELKEENELNKIIKDTKLDELFCRRNGKKVEQAIKLRDELLKLPECKLYGIKKCKKNVILIIKEEVISVQKVRGKIEEMQKEYNKLDKQVDEYINDANKDSTKFYKNRERISTMQALSYFINILKELIERRK